MIAGLNLSGALNLKEITRMVNQAREAIAIKAREEANAKNPFLALSSGDQMVRIFGVKAFVECVLKIGIGYLSFHGTVAQSEMRAQPKVIWILTFLHSAFSKHCMSNKILAKLHVSKPNISNNWSKFIEATTSTSSDPGASGGGYKDKKERGLSLFVAGMEAKGLSTTLGELAAEEKRKKENEHDSGSSGDSDEEVEQARKEIAKTGWKKMQNLLASGAFAKSLPPLKRLIVQKPKLFSAAPSRSPALRGFNFSRSGPCPACGCLPLKGWGAPSCSTCGLGDVILRACLDDERPEELPVLHRILRATDRLNQKR
jgi:hypothetical protein